MFISKQFFNSSQKNQNSFLRAHKKNLNTHPLLQDSILSIVFTESINSSINSVSETNTFILSSADIFNF